MKTRWKVVIVGLVLAVGCLALFNLGTIAVVLNLDSRMDTQEYVNCVDRNWLKALLGYAPFNYEDCQIENDNIMESEGLDQVPDYVWPDEVEPTPDPTPDNSKWRLVPNEHDERQS